MKSKNHETSFDWSEVEFCPSCGQCDLRNLASLISEKVLDGNLSGEMVAFYENLQNSYGKARTLFCSFPADHFQDGRVKHGLLRYANVGLDLPVWVRKKGATGLKVTIVAQDPFRSGFGNGHMILSTPFGLHSPLCPRNNSMFYELIKNFLIQDAIVYVTDCSKVCYGLPPGVGEKCATCEKLECENHGIGEDYERSEDCYRDILKEELKLFDPNVIVVLGKAATQSLFPSFPIGDFRAYARDRKEIEHQFVEDKTVRAWTLIHPSRRNYSLLSRMHGKGKVKSEDVENNVRKYYRKSAKKIMGKMNEGRSLI